MKQIKEKKHVGKREAETGAKPWELLLRGTLCAGIAVVCLLAVTAVLVSASVLPAERMEIYVSICCCVGAWIGGRVALGRGRRGILWGCCVGGCAAMLFAVSGLLLYGGVVLPRCVLNVAMCVLGGAASGVFCVNTGRKRKT